MIEPKLLTGISVSFQINDIMYSAHIGKKQKEVVKKQGSKEITEEYKLL